MVKNVYAVYDSKVCYYLSPMILLNDAEARRLMSDFVADPATPVSKHPADFRIVRIGEYDDASGKLSGLASPEFVAEAVEFVSVK